MVKCRIFRLGKALGFAMAAAAMNAGTALSEVPQDPHRAFYRLALGKMTGASGIVGASGAMTAEWERSCEGWTATQKLTVTMERQEGAAIVSTVSASLFETHDGTKLRFTSKTTVDSEVVEQVRGRAERPSADAPGKARYIEPAGVTVDLPAGTLFPYQHTLAVLDAALSGENRDFSLFFDGSQPEESPLEVNSLVLGAARPATQGVGAGLGPLTDHIWWPVRLAFFTVATADSEPDIEMTQYIQENGVVRQFDFDYEGFIIVATLDRIEAIPVPNCQ